ncbi:MAG: tetratricopeptide repeat protein [Aridibacter sp.]
MRQKLFIFIFVFCFIFAVDSSYSQNRSRSVSQATRTITVLTEPNTTIWIDGIKRGVTDESGKLIVKPVMAGTRKLRVRADGFKEIEKPLLPTQKGDVKIDLVKTNDPAELAYQEAEKMSGEDKNKAIELYEKAVKLRPNFPEAYLGLARVLSDTGNYNKALEAIKKAKKYRPIYPEATAVEGRIYKDIGEYDSAIDAFDRAVKEGKGFQPEAYTGIALLFKDEAESAKADNDLDDMKYYYGEAAKSFEKAIEQLSATEPIVYLFLGTIYENLGDKKKAIAVYERFLRDMPDNEERTAVESFIVQLKKPDVIQ